MSVASRNPFALLDEESSRPGTPAAASAKPKEEAPAAPAPANTQKPRGGPASRGGRYYQRGRGGKSNGRDENVAPEDDATSPAEGNGQRRFDGEGRGRGRGRGRGGRGGRGRPFDRHSATGKTDSDKKVHQGWGGDEGNTELRAEVEGNSDAVADTNDLASPAPNNDWAGTTSNNDWAGTTSNNDWAGGDNSADAWNAPADSGDAAPTATEEKTGDRPARREREPREPEEEDNTLTYDQYLAKKKEEAAELVPKLETRKANEGDDSIWKDAVPLKKDEGAESYFAGKTKTSAPKTKAKKDEKVYLEIDARFERPSRGGRGGRGGDRGDRGDRGRGGRGRGSGRGRANGPSTPVVNVDDETAFPALA